MDFLQLPFFLQPSLYASLSNNLLHWAPLVLLCRLSTLAVRASVFLKLSTVISSWDCNFFHPICMSVPNQPPFMNFINNVPIIFDNASYFSLWYFISSCFPTTLLSEIHLSSCSVFFLHHVLFIYSLLCNFLHILFP